MPPGPNEYQGNSYTVLKDVLQRPAEIDSDRVYYRPGTTEKQYLEAFVRPERVASPVGPDTPTVTVRWNRVPPYDTYRIDYADPNVSFHCGWHSDDDHPEYGSVHFQYEHPGLDETAYESATFEATSPPRILWEALDRLFHEIIPSHVAPLYDTDTHS